MRREHRSALARSILLLKLCIIRAHFLITAHTKGRVRALLSSIQNSNIPLIILGLFSFFLFVSDAPFYNDIYVTRVNHSTANLVLVIIIIIIIFDNG